MKIGVIFVAFGMEDYVIPSLSSWIEAKFNRLQNNDFLICAVNCPFLEFDANHFKDNTRLILNNYLINKKIDNLITNDIPISETDARSSVLEYLVQNEVDYIIQVDADEFYTNEDIANVFDFVKKNPYICWFRICLKNLVFTENQWMKEPFTPPRIHSVKFQKYSIKYSIFRFWDDNNILYNDINSKTILKRDLEFPNLTIPSTLVWVKHHSWLSNNRSKDKIKYQNKRWGHCSFEWNDILQKLEWNESYFISQGKTIPEIETK